jgi:hypothetical protein
VKVNRDYVIGAFIGGAAVSLLNIPRVSSLKEDSNERQAQYSSKVQELDRQLRQARNKDEIIELQRQQSIVDKAEIDSLLKANESLHSRISQLEQLVKNTQIPIQEFNGLTIEEYVYIVHVWRAHSAYLSNQVNNLLQRLNIDSKANSATFYHKYMIEQNERLTNKVPPDFKSLAQLLKVNTSVFDTYNSYIDIVN